MSNIVRRVDKKGEVSLKQLLDQTYPWNHSTMIPGVGLYIDIDAISVCHSVSYREVVEWGERGLVYTFILVDFKISYAKKLLYMEVHLFHEKNLLLMNPVFRAILTPSQWSVTGMS